MISLLAASGSEEAVPAFLEYLQGAEPRFRLDLARSLGCLAAENCIEPVNLILAGEEEGLRGVAMVGIGQALAAGQGVPAFFLSIRRHLVELLNNIEGSIVSDLDGENLTLTCNACGAVVGSTQRARAARTMRVVAGSGTGL